MEAILVHRTEFAASTPSAPVREAADPDKIGEDRVTEDPNLTPEPPACRREQYKTERPLGLSRPGGRRGDQWTPSQRNTMEKIRRLHYT